MSFERNAATGVRGTQSCFARITQLFPPYYPSAPAPGQRSEGSDRWLGKRYGVTNR